MKPEPVPLDHVVFVAAIAWALATGGVVLACALVAFLVRTFL